MARMKLVARNRQGAKGAASGAKYVTRAGALKRTQLRLGEFRRMCILKGIYPREPKRKFRGPEATYYHMKDIQCLNRDPLMPLFRSEKAHEKKIKKAVGRRAISTARHYAKTKPTYTLHHLVKERYPTLLDAVRDLDDPLCTLSLFASLPAEDQKGISQAVLTGSARIVDEFHFLVANCGLLTKAFASIKGFYFSAEILGQAVTWLVPHQYAQELPFEVDFRIMSTFQELHACILKFVNFKLFALNGISYPPNVDKDLVKTGIRHLSLSGVKLGNASGEDNDDNAAMSGADQVVGESVGTAPGSALPQGVFSGLVVYVSREVPLAPVALILQSGGARLGWDSDTSPIAIEDPCITHHFVDRSPEQLESLNITSADLPPRTYLQPQWAFDCLNNGVLLPTGPYTPGVQPPPHLSPFVDDLKEGYIPKQRELLDAIVAEKKRDRAQIRRGGKEDDNEEQDEEDEDELDEEAEAQIENVALAEQYQQEIEREAQGTWFSRTDDKPERRKEIAKELFDGPKAQVGSSKLARKKQREKDSEERRMALLSNRKRKLKQQMEEQSESVKRKASNLERKRLQQAAAMTNA